MFCIISIYLINIILNFTKDIRCIRILNPSIALPFCSHRYTPDNVPGLYRAIFPYFPPIMLIYIVCLDILFIHFPASTHRVVVATGSPLMMVTAPFLQIGELLPEHPATPTFDHLGLYNLLNSLEDMKPGPSPPISTAPEPSAFASCHPSSRSIH